MEQDYLEEGEEVNDAQLKEIVANVVMKMNGIAPSSNHHLGIFEDMNEAITAAKVAQKKLRQMPLETRDQIIDKIREKIMANKEILARMAVEETGMGKVGHKILKHELVAKKTPGTECIKIDAWSGDQGLTLVERGPYGVIGAITPSTNPSETVFCNGIGMIAAGNTVVFNPHPGATKTANY